MEKMRGRKRTGKLFTLALIVSLAVTFTPVFGESADPVTDQVNGAEVTEVTTPEGGVRSVDAEGESAPAEEPKEAKHITVSAEDGEDASDLIKEIKAENLNEGESLQGAVMAVPSVCKVQKSTYTGTTYTLQCSILPEYQSQGYRFEKILVDKTIVYDYKSNATSINLTIDISGLETGYHTLVVSVTKGGTYVYEQFLVHTKIYINRISAKPDYKGSFTTYPKKIVYAPYNIGYANSSGDLYLEYSGNGGKSWQRSGYMRKNLIELGTQIKYQQTGLKPNTSYRTRIRYGEFVEYSTDLLGDGKSYFFGGPVLYTGTYKTGKGTKPAVKKIKVNVTKVKYHKVKHYGYYTGVYLYTEKFYTYKIKVTVNLKKKPGTKGIWLNGRWLKGNKKKYTTVFSPYPNYATKKPPKGFSKYTVSLSSGQAKGYGGYSPTFKKSYKVKKH